MVAGGLQSQVVHRRVTNGTFPGRGERRLRSSITIKHHEIEQNVSCISKKIASQCFTIHVEVGGVDGVKNSCL